MACKILVYTGDKPNAGTNANVKIKLHDDKATYTEEFSLDVWFHDDFEKGNVGEYKVTIPDGLNFGQLKKIEFWRDNAGVGANWYVDRISVEIGKDHFDFPVFRWIKAHHHYLIQHLDTSLPQFDEHKQQRHMELEEKKQQYKLKVKIPGLPAQAAEMPVDEKFSDEHQWDMKKLKFQLGFDTLITRLKTGKWDSLDSLKNVYITNHLPEPRSTKTWQEDSHFANQRIAGVNPILIKRCTEIPESFGVTDAMVAPFLEGLTLTEAIQKRSLFIVDLHVLEGVPCSSDEYVLCAPLALFFENKERQLMPVAIQLFQNKGPSNPVFLPSDPPMTWLLVKMWYNNADAAYHQALTHLGFTHLIMEGISVITSRNLSQSHPIFKLLAPHFLYIIAINNLGLSNLISEGGWIDTVQGVGIKGTFHMIREGIKRWRMDVDGTVPEDLKQRGLLNMFVLRRYPYRTDALMLYMAIKSYVQKIVDLYYDSPAKLEGDTEIQSWAQELVTPRDKGGCGILGVPGEGNFTSKDQLVLVLTSIISTCSLAHGAFNFPQYETYAFIPNYPLLMKGRPPTDKTPRSEADILASLSDKPTTLDCMLVAQLLSNKGTNSLGDFETNLVFDPKALKIIGEFKADLAQISSKIKRYNKTRKIPYEWLDPEFIPNSIGI